MPTHQTLRSHHDGLHARGTDFVHSRCWSGDRQTCLVKHTQRSGSCTVCVSSKHQHVQHVQHVLLSSKHLCCGDCSEIKPRQGCTEFTCLPFSAPQSYRRLKELVASELVLHPPAARCPCTPPSPPPVGFLQTTDQKFPPQASL